MTSVISVLKMAKILFGNLGIRYCRNKPCFSAKIKSSSCQIKMNALFKKKGNMILIYIRLWAFLIVFFKQMKKFCESLSKKRMLIGIWWSFFTNISWSTTTRHCSFSIIIFSVISYYGRKWNMEQVLIM